MAREPVAVDYMGVGERGSAPGSSSNDGSSEERVRLVSRPIPSVPENHRAHLQSRRSPGPDGGRDGSSNSSPFAQGLSGDYSLLLFFLGAILRSVEMVAVGVMVCILCE